MDIQESEPFPHIPKKTRSKKTRPIIPRTVMQETVEDKVMLILHLFEAILITNDVVVPTHGDGDGGGGLKYPSSSSTNTTTNNLSPFNTTTLYRVVFGFWPVRPGAEECWTPLVEGGPHPIWNRTFKIDLTNIPREWDSLTVELMRYDSVCSDPGTSTGTKLVGRALIPLPDKVNTLRRYCSHSLKRLEGESDYKIHGLIRLDLLLCPIIMEMSSSIWP